MAMIAQGQLTIVDLNDPIQQGIAPSAPAEGMLWLDTSQSPPVLKRWSGNAWETINEVEVGGVNLIANSAAYSVIASSSDTFWVAADELISGSNYIFTVDEVRRDAGTATGASWA